jgi:hypothetical protein
MDLETTIMLVIHAQNLKDLIYQFFKNFSYKLFLLLYDAKPDSRLNLLYKF